MAMAHRVRLVAFDFDGVLSPDTQLVRLADRCGVLSEIHELILEWRSGRRGFRECHLDAVSRLKGLSKKEVDAVADSVRLTEGASECIRSLEEMGVLSIVVSNGYMQVCGLPSSRVGIRRVFANSLQWNPSRDALAGTMVPTVVDDIAKGRVLSKVQRVLGVSKSETAAIGNDHNDLSMFDCAGLKILFAPDDIEVGRLADIVIPRDDFCQIARVVLAGHDMAPTTLK